MGENEGGKLPPPSAPWAAGTALPQSDPRRIKAKVCLVGDPSVGKSSLIRRFVLDQYEDHYLATIGTKVSKKEVGLSFAGFGESFVELMVWDIMGQPGFRELLAEAYFYGADGILAVADITRRESLDRLPGWIDAVVRTRGQVPIVVVANKADLEGQAAFGVPETASVTRASGADIFLASAKTGANVEAVFHRLATRIVDRLVPLSGESLPESP